MDDYRIDITHNYPLSYILWVYLLFLGTIYAFFNKKLYI